MPWWATLLVEAYKVILGDVWRHLCCARANARSTVPHMPNVVNVQPQVLRDVAKSINALTATMTGAVQRSAPSILALEPAGTDAASAKAVTSTIAFATEFLNSAGKSANELDRCAAALIAAADGYEAQDLANAKPFTRSSRRARA
jgi:PE family